jgi:hypothetical protein
LKQIPVNTPQVAPYNPPVAATDSGTNELKVARETTDHRLFLLNTIENLAKETQNDAHLEEVKKPKEEMARQLLNDFQNIKK